MIISKTTVVPSTALSMSPSRMRLFKSLPEHRKQAILDLKRFRMLGEAAWKVAMEASSQSIDTIDTIRFKNLPRKNGVEYNLEEMEKEGLVLLFLPQEINGERVTVNLFKKLGFRFSFNSHVIGYEDTEELFSEMSAPAGTYLLREEIYPGSTSTSLQAQKRILPKGFSLSYPLVEVSKNILLHSLGEKVNNNFLARCVCPETQTTSVIGGIEEKRIHFYRDGNISGRIIGASAMKPIS